MSSPIHAAFCVSRTASAVDVTLVPTPACGAHFPFSRFFGLFLLYESATTLVDRRGEPLWWSQAAPGGPIASALDFDELMELTSVETPDDRLLRPKAPEVRRAHAARKRELVDRHVARVSYVAVFGWAPRLATATAGHYLDPAKGSSPIASRASDELREAMRALQAAFDGATEDTLPTATLRIEATDPRWVAHLEPGMSWDVYAFDDDAGLLV